MRLLMILITILTLSYCVSLINPNFSRPSACERLTPSMRQAILECRVSAPPPCNGVVYLPPSSHIWDCPRNR
jgi:hypothetical protein